MTAQIGEVLIYNEKQYGMATTPLSSYLINRRDLTLDSPHSACWRGYVGTWEIQENRLYLLDFRRFIEGSLESDLQFLFPEQDKVFAHWFTDTIRLPMGECIYYSHSGYDSVFEKDVFLEFRDGVLISEKEVKNRKEDYDHLKDLPF
jgi:hypothetical protein